MSNTYYGEFGGQFVSESLMNTLAELEKAFDEAIKDPKFIADYNYYLKEYVGIRLIMLSDRFFWQSAWERQRLSPKPAQDSTVLQQQPAQLYLTWNVPYIWVRKILKDSV